MKIENNSKFLKYILPLSFSTFFILYFIKNKNIDYVSVDMDIPSDLEMEESMKNPPLLRNFN